LVQYVTLKAQDAFSSEHDILMGVIVKINMATKSIMVTAVFVIVVALGVIATDSIATVKDNPWAFAKMGKTAMRISPQGLEHQSAQGGLQELELAVPLIQLEDKSKQTACCGFNPAVI
jgi:hypothetical protein